MYIYTSENSIIVLPAPHRPDGRRPLWMLSLFILLTTLKAVVDTAWNLSPNSRLYENLKIYKQGSIWNKNKFIF